MKALVYEGPGRKALQERAVPKLQTPNDAIVKYRGNRGRRPRRVGCAADRAQFYSPSEIIVIDPDAQRLAIAKRLGATAAVDPSHEEAVQAVMRITGGRGADTVMEAVGIPATFVTCEGIVAPGGTIANIGVHGAKADLHLETRSIACWTPMRHLATPRPLAR